MYRLLATLLISIALFLVFETKQTRAQSRTEPFSRIEIRASGTRNLDQNGSLDLWTPRYAGTGIISTPFYAGHVHGGLRVQPFDARSLNQPSFLSAYMFLGWGFRLSLSDHFQFESGGRVGNYFMAFDDDILAGLRNESELAVSAYHSMHVYLSNGFGFFIEGSYTRIFTFIRMNMTHVSAGLTIRLRTPEWLRTFLR